MSITEAVGTSTPPVIMTIDRGRLLLFAKAVGITDPVHVDVDAARAAGHPNLLVPPTFLFGVELERPEPFGWLTGHGVDMGSVLHGTQSFDYLAPVHAGDEVVAESSITDVQQKKGGALTMVERQTNITRQGTRAARLTSVIVIRDGAS
jgi:acyl dehydratase